MTLKAAGSAITELTAQHWVSGRCRDLRDFPTCTALMGEYVASIEDVRTLRHAALLPNCQAIFEAEMRIVCLPRETAKVQLPQSADESNEVIKKALGWLNRPKLGVSRLTIDPEVVRNDCLQLSGDQEDRAADIHPEIKVLLHLYRINKNKTIKTSSSLPAFGYIGISKLSCLGCSIFISTFNDVLHTRFPTQGIETGRYSKCRYFPWAFPLDGCPDLANIVAAAYGKLVNHWGPSYDGFVLERRRFAADSIEEPSLLPQDPGDGGVEEWLEQEEERMARKRKADRLDG